MPLPLPLLKHSSELPPGVQGGFPNQEFDAFGSAETIRVVFRPTVKESPMGTLSVNVCRGSGTQTLALSGTRI
jgi:hypothetical protein